MLFNQALVAISALAFLVAGHPGESQAEKRAEAKARAQYLASLENTDLAHCVGLPATQNVMRRTMERRREIATQLTKRFIKDADAGLEKRQTADWNRVLQKSHKSNLDVSASLANADWVLLGQNRSTVLNPQVTEGPYCKSLNLLGPRIIKD
jgi:hypothetical protein